MEGEVHELKEQCNKSVMIIEQKNTEIKILQTDNDQKLMDVKKCQTKLEEKVTISIKGNHYSSFFYCRKCRPRYYKQKLNS